jgi:hypothetical protein
MLVFTYLKKAGHLYASVSERLHFSPQVIKSKYIIFRISISLCAAYISQMYEMNLISEGIH